MLLFNAIFSPFIQQSISQGREKFVIALGWKSFLPPHISHYKFYFTLYHAKVLKSYNSLGSRKKELLLPMWVFLQLTFFKN